jgi:putative membrane protein
MRKTVIAGAVVLALSAAPAFAAGKKQGITSKQVSDQEFVIHAAKGDMAEIELGKVAQTKASAESVKTFAKRMIDDHQRALDSLKPIAMNEKITVPTTIDPKDQALKERLEKLSGRAFDRAYMSAMIKDHRHDVAEFRAASTKARSADVKQYASTILPSLEKDLKLGQTAEKSVMAASGKQGSKKPVA